MGSVFLQMVFSFVAFFKAMFFMLSTMPLKLIGLVRAKIEQVTASIVETIHGMFMLPTLLRK